MKKTITAFLILISSVSFSQEKQDTTVKKQPKYFLVAELPALQLLIKALDKPDDVTRGEIKALLQWVYSARELPEEKPKSETKKEK